MLQGASQRGRSDVGVLVGAEEDEVPLAPLTAHHLPAGDIWKSYFASRLAWSTASQGRRNNFGNSVANTS
jgi:hypothetical protein